ncbi:DUF1456 domain-containing protein, partial [Salmonella enterica subsp. enterica serovar Kentucky]|nr:DUF1456 domain-containing protein [Salmonella enterica]EAP2129837.1 DUF1456 domain-containing protein [Salmonella enterica subsp. enterica serovar Kentucky]EAP8609568.1 DUF1456 domain-containing protein [Salmonella enterica]ECU7080235.1 DUF1456 domain-containing protein [Salmonella enterica subsp. enterica serovar Kentucky]ECU7220814.1 DUF1456 domain-containing protein [Salmonella enterica subsp. enterica serovar Kentucky]
MACKRLLEYRFAIETTEDLML